MMAANFEKYLLSITIPYVPVRKENLVCRVTIPPTIMRVCLTCEHRQN